jgi:hypothetical protein
LSRFIARAERYLFERAMTAEERSSSAGRPELDLDKERDDSKDDGAPVAGGLCRLDAPDSVTDKDPG